jgi:multicomponent Na+:H+ antiporter subunit D
MTSNPLSVFVIVPLVASVVAVFISKFRGKMADLVSIAVLIAGLFIAGSYVYYGRGIPMLVFENSSYATDYFAILMIALVYTIALLVAFFSSQTIKEQKRRGVFFALITLCAGAMSGIIIARDFFSIYVFLEVVAVCSFVLIGFEKKKTGLEGALKYFFLSAPASIFIILSIALLVMNVGSPSFDALSHALRMGSTKSFPLIFGLMICGFLIKAGVVPFHAWVPDAYQSAPSPISAYLAGIISKVAGLYVLVRISMIMGFVYPSMYQSPLGKALMFFGAASILVGAIAALTQRDFKRLLAYSSISQVGYIVLALGLGTPLAIAGAVFHLLNHAIFKSSLFFNSAALETATGTTLIPKLGGLESKMRWTSWTSVVAMLSTAGIPPLSGFWSKLIIIVALWTAGAKGYAAVALLASILTLSYFLIVQRRVFFGQAKEELKDVKEVKFAMLLPVFILTLLIIALGIFFPIIFPSIIGPSIRMLI